MRTLSYRIALGLAGLTWVCIATTLCGCSPMNGALMNRSGMAYYEKGNFTAARHDFERALADNPYNSNYAYNVASAMQKQGDLPGSERMYHHAITLDPGHQPSFHGLAGLMRHQGRAAEAQELIHSWAATQPYDAEAHLEMAWLQKEQGDFAGAEQSLQQALRINPHQPAALAHLGQVYQQMGRGPEAASLYRRSLMMNPSQPHVQSQLGSLAASGMASPGLHMAMMMPQTDPTMTPSFAYRPAAPMMVGTYPSAGMPQTFETTYGAPGDAPHPGMVVPPPYGSPIYGSPMIESSPVQLGTPVPISQMPGQPGVMHPPVQMIGASMPVINAF